MYSIGTTKYVVGSLQLYSPNTERRVGMVEKLIAWIQLDTNVSMVGQISGQRGCNFFVELLQDGNIKTHESEPKNPLQGSLAGNGAMTVRNSL